MTSHLVKRAGLAGLVLGVACLLPCLAPGEKAKPVGPLDRERIDRRIAEVQPTAKERRFDAIGWASSIGEAERLGRANGRPVFLFVNVGQMDTGRC